jgi:hypothetical protein
MTARQHAQAVVHMILRMEEQAVLRRGIIIIQRIYLPVAAAVEDEGDDDE